MGLRVGDPHRTDVAVVFDDEVHGRHLCCLSSASPKSDRLPVLYRVTVYSESHTV